MEYQATKGEGCNMNKEQLWQTFLTDKPHLAQVDDDTKILITKGTLKRCIYWACNESEREALRFKGGHQSRAVDDLMGMFGMRR